MRLRAAFAGLLALSGVLLLALSISTRGRQDGSASPQSQTIAVAPQYDTTHVYLSAQDLAPFVASFLATFGGEASKPAVANVLPVAGAAEWQSVHTPVGVLSVFAFQTPIPFPFGEERTGYLVTDMDQAIARARSSGADVIVEPFKDPIGMDSIIQWPGGLKMQLYWHFTPSKSPSLETIPENRVYVSHDSAERFIAAFTNFSQGRVVADDSHADAGEIGRPGDTYRRILISSAFGNILVLVTDGHLPYPFGRENTGYEVADLTATLQKARAANVKTLSEPYPANGRTSAIVEFPGGYIAEIHSRNPAHP
jgi:hypothetical protein